MLLLTAALFFFRIRAKKRRASSVISAGPLWRESTGTWIGTRLGESRANTPAAATGLQPSAADDDIINEMRQPSHLTPVYLGHRPRERSTPSPTMTDSEECSWTVPSSTTQLVFPQHHHSPPSHDSQPTPLKIPAIHVSDIDAPYDRPSSRLAYRDPVIPLETPIEEHAIQNPFLHMSTKRESNSTSASSWVPFDPYGGVVLGGGEVQAETPPITPRMTMKSFKADLIFPPSPVDNIDRFLDVPQMSSTASSTVNDAKGRYNANAPSSTLRSFSPGPTSNAGFLRHQETR